MATFLCFWSSDMWEKCERGSARYHSQTFGSSTVRQCTVVGATPQDGVFVTGACLSVTLLTD